MKILSTYKSTKENNAVSFSEWTDCFYNGVALLELPLFAFIEYMEYLRYWDNHTLNTDSNYINVESIC